MFVCLSLRFIKIDSDIKNILLSTKPSLTTISVSYKFFKKSNVFSFYNISHCFLFFTVNIFIFILITYYLLIKEPRPFTFIKIPSILLYSVLKYPLTAQSVLFQNYIVIM